MKIIRVAFVGSAMAVMSGCVAVPVDHGYYGGPPAVYAPAPAYYGPPVYLAPSIGFGFYGGGHGHRHWHH